MILVHNGQCMSHAPLALCSQMFHHASSVSFIAAVSCCSSQLSHTFSLHLLYTTPLVSIDLYYHVTSRGFALQCSSSYSNTKCLPVLMNLPAARGLSLLQEIVDISSRKCRKTDYLSYFMSVSILFAIDYLSTCMPNPRG